MILPSENIISAEARTEVGDRGATRNYPWIKRFGNIAMLPLAQVEEFDWLHKNSQ